MYIGHSLSQSMEDYIRELLAEEKIVGIRPEVRYLRESITSCITLEYCFARERRSFEVDTPGEFEDLRKMAQRVVDDIVAWVDR